MLCPSCHKRIVFHNMSLVHFDSNSRRYFHKECWTKKQLRAKKARVEAKQKAMQQQITEFLRSF